MRVCVYLEGEDLVARSGFRTATTSGRSGSPAWR